MEANNFIKGKEKDFISYCETNNIDYISNYKSAVVEYYQARLNSIKK